MSLDDLFSFHNSKLPNDTENGNYFSICRNHPMTPLIWGIFTVICVLLGFPASVIVLRELYQRRRQNISNDFFVFNLTVIDLTFLGIVAFNVVNYIVWHINEFEYFCNFMYGLVMSGRPLFMACVCGDYYFAVIHPIIYRTSKRMEMIRKTIATIIWLFIISYGCVIVIYPWTLTTAIASIPLLIALPAICFCDITVYRALRKKDPSGKNNVHPQKKRAMRTIINSFVMTFTTYLPPAVIYIMGHKIPMSFDDYYCTFIFLAVSFTDLGSVIMPFMYLESIGQLDLKKMLEKIKFSG